RRQERLERERAAAVAAARRRRLQYALGGLLAVALVAGVVIVATAAVGGGKSGAEGQPTQASASVKIPAQQIGDLNAAAKAAGCTLNNPPYEGAGHLTKEFKPSDYKTNPPTSGS